MNRAGLLYLSLLLSAFLPSAVASAAAQMSKPLAYLTQGVGQMPTAVFKTQPLQHRLIALLGKTEFDALIENMDPATEISQDNGVLYATGNAPHRGGEEEAVLMIDPQKDAVQVFLLHKSTVVRGWAENNRLVSIPREVQAVLNRWPKAALMQTLTAMRASAAPGASAAGPTLAPVAAQNICQTGATCDENPSFAATIVDFRTSVGERVKIVTATVRFTNKLSRALTLGLVRDSGVALDDQGNRYSIFNEGNVRGIGLIVNNSFDPKFTLQPGESADARIDFLLNTGSNIIYGTSWDASFSVREIDSAGVGQYRMGREREVRFPGLVNRITTRSASAAAPSNPAASVPAAYAAGAGSSAPAQDPCEGAPRCYSTPLYTATIRSFTAASVGDFHDHVLRFEVNFRNISNQPIILAYGALTSSAIDNLGNQYSYAHGREGDGSAAGIGVSQSSKANPEFVLQPGESRNAVLQTVRYRVFNQQVGTSFTYSVTIKQLEILPSQQIREVRDFAMTYPDLTPTSGMGVGRDTPQKLNDSIRKLGGIFGKK